MNEDQEITRGERAQQILEDPLVVEAFELIRANLIAEWESSKAIDKDGREEAWRMLKVLNEIQRHLISVLESGKMAKKARKQREAQNQ